MELRKGWQAYHENDIYTWCSRVRFITLPKLGRSQKVKRFLSVIRDMCYVALDFETSFQNTLVYSVIYDMKLVGIRSQSQKQA